MSSALAELGEFEVRVTRARSVSGGGRGFAFMWDPGGYLDTQVRVVLVLALSRQHESTRFKEVVRPSTQVWMHHLEVGSVEEVDGEVVGWLGEAYQAGD